MLPKIDNIYKFDQTPADVEAMFLSHGHLDLSAYLSFIKREIPVYCGETTQTILKTLSQVTLTEKTKEYKRYARKSYLP